MFDVFIGLIMHIAFHTVDWAIWRASSLWNILLQLGWKIRLWRPSRS